MSRVRLLLSPLLLVLLAPVAHPVSLPSPAAFVTVT